MIICKGDMEGLRNRPISQADAFPEKWVGSVIRRPLVGVAVAVTAGMLLGASELLAPDAVFLTAFIVLLLSFLFIRFHCSVPFTFLSVALVAACRFTVADPDISANSVAETAGRLPLEKVEVVGRITGFPSYRSAQEGRGGVWMFPVQCRAIMLSSDGWYKTTGEMNIRLFQPVLEELPYYGRRVHLKGTLRRGLFPSSSGVELEVPAPEYCFFLKTRSVHALVGKVSLWRDALSARLAQGLVSLPVHQAVLKALVLGQRSTVPDEVMEHFRRTGTLHIFAISGLHVGIVGLLLAGLLKAFGIPRDHYAFYLIPLLALYVVATGMKSSALRALAMAAIYLVAPLFRRKPDIPGSVAFAAVLLLFFQPLELLSVGFIYSFSVVVFIVMVFASVPRNWLKGGWSKRYVSSLAITSFAAGLASIPLTALFFGMFSPIAFAGNLIVVPLTFFIVLSGWLSLLVPFATSVFNHAAAFFIELLLAAVNWMDRLPGSSCPVSPPPLSTVLLWYGSLVYLFTHARSTDQRIYALSGAGCAVLMGVFVWMSGSAG